MARKTRQQADVPDSASEQPPDPQHHTDSSDVPAPTPAPEEGAPGNGEIPCHPAAEIFPDMTATEYESLRKDIATHGQLIPIVRYGRQIVDGRHRFRVCRELGIEPQFVEWDGQGQILDFLFSMNVRRRNLTTPQLAFIGARALPFYQPQARQRMLDGRAPDPTRMSEEGSTGEAAEQIAGQLGISADAVYAAKKVLEKGTPELPRAVEAGKMTLWNAAKLASLPLRKQQKTLAGGNPAVKEELKKTRQKEAARKQTRKTARNGKAVPDADNPQTVEVAEGTQPSTLLITLTSDDRAIAEQLIDRLGHPRAVRVRDALTAALAGEDLATPVEGGVSSRS
jgi:hypothetical protein